MTLTEIQEGAYANAEARGFHEGDCDLWKFLGNLHSEVSEAWEELRKPDCDPKRVRFLEGGKPVGFPIELADIIIRIADTAKWAGIDLEAALKDKMIYNVTRPYRHGGKRA